MEQAVVEEEEEDGNRNPAIIHIYKCMFCNLIFPHGRCACKLSSSFRAQCSCTQQLYGGLLFYSSDGRGKGWSAWRVLVVEDFDDLLFIRRSVASKTHSSWSMMMMVVMVVEHKNKSAQMDFAFCVLCSSEIINCATSEICRKIIVPSRKLRFAGCSSSKAGEEWKNVVVVEMMEEKHQQKSHSLKTETFIN